MKRLVAALTLAVVMAVGVAPVAHAGGKCAPGQHGNPHPAFKPGSCK
ncbi:MAG TPA: hypothetical protein VNP73_10830 [Actinomycetota bacterium]|nr:hypothetical protein [Actinomycetota bacterium]